jgi:hypothetical protein
MTLGSGQRRSPRCRPWRSDCGWHCRPSRWRGAGWEYAIPARGLWRTMAMPRFSIDNFQCRELYLSDPWTMPWMRHSFLDCVRASATSRIRHLMPFLFHGAANEMQFETRQQAIVRPGAFAWIPDGLESNIHLRRSIACQRSPLLNEGHEKSR